MKRFQFPIVRRSTAAMMAAQAKKDLRATIVEILEHADKVLVGHNSTFREVTFEQPIAIIGDGVTVSGCELHADPDRPALTVT